MYRPGIFVSVVAAGLGLLSPAFAQSTATTVYMPAILELSGAGAVSGTNFRDGMLLAVEEINAKGGILGKKIDMPLLDTQSEAGVAARKCRKCSTTSPTSFSARCSPARCWSTCC